MKITDIKLTKNTDSDTELAKGSISLEGQVVINGIRVIKGQDGEPIVVYPSMTNSKKERRDICFPMTRTLREDIHRQVIAKYEGL